MNKSCCAVVLVASTALAALSVEAELRASKVSESSRPYFSGASNEWSGITYAGNDLYYVVDDKDKKLYSLTMKIGADGSLVQSNITKKNSWDMGVNETEGCAFDPASGRIWISRESDTTIREFDLGSSEFVRSVPVPSIMKQIHSNRSLEALTISGDGKTMWTCNEEALQCDGDLATRSHGTVVRLTRFSRSSVYDNWSPSGQWAYKTRAIASEATGSNVSLTSNSRHGVPALTALPDGTLLVLERGYFKWGDLADDFEYYLYAIAPSEFSAAKDISNISSLKGASYSCVTKYWVWSNYNMKGSNYEGMCLGPSLSANAVALVLVADGGGGANNKIMTLKLYNNTSYANANIRTLNVNTPAPVGVPSFVGQNYRFTNGTHVVVDLLGDGVGERAYTNRGDQVYSIDWSLPGHNNKKGKGAHVEFNITADDTLSWSVASKGADQTSKIYAHDTFEEFPIGAVGTDIKNWSGNGEVVANKYTPPMGKYILDRAGVGHEKVLDAQDGATRDLRSMQLPAGDKNYRMDIMVEILKPQQSLAPLSSNSKFAIAVDNDGRIKAWHTVKKTSSAYKNEWSSLSSATYAKGTWVHVSAEFCRNSNGAFAKVWIDGKECTNVDGGSQQAEIPAPNSKGSWLMLPNSATPTKLVLKGTKADDLIVATPEFIQSLPASASIMVSPSAVSGASAAGGQAYTVSTAVAAPAAAPALASSAPSAAQTSQSAVAAPAIVGFGIAPTKRPQIRFTGYAEGVEYRVVCSSTVDFRNASVIDGGIVRVQTGDDGVSVVATWEGAEPSDPASGAKFYRVEVVEAAAE